MGNAEGVGVIFTHGNWGSGTTFVTGVLTLLGAHSCPPHYRRIDPRTKNSLECSEFRKACMSVYDETNLQEIGSKSAFSHWFDAWLRDRKQDAMARRETYIVLKHPLCAFLIREIADIASPAWVLVTRDFGKTENRRLAEDGIPHLGRRARAPSIAPLALP